jgi:3-hydroxyisobutyrate dehydrogenase
MRYIFRFLLAPFILNKKCHIHFKNLLRRENAMKDKIGFIGVGFMGKPMSLNLLKAGYRIIAYDINPIPLQELKGKNASIATSCKEVAAESDIVITMLPNSKDVEQAILGEAGVAEGVKPGSIVVDMSTIDPSISKKIAETLSKRGVKMLDAPVSGGQMGAEAGTLAIMVGGDEEIYKRCLDIFHVMGKKIYYCGGNGNGEVVKIANNLLAGINAIASTEALAMGVKAGVNLKVLYDVISASSGQNFIMQFYAAVKALKGDFEPGFMADLMYKDLGLAMNLAKEERIPMIMGALAHQTFSLANTKGLGKKDFTILFKMMEDLTNARLRLE